MNQVLSNLKTIPAVWLVEDNDIFRNTIGAVLQQSGKFNCSHQFSSCEDALSLLDDAVPPDIILLDIGLPGISGIEGIKRFKAITPSVHIIILTVYDDDDNVFQAICAGASGYLLKSSSEEKIIDSIEEVLNGGASVNAHIARKVLDMFTSIAAPKNDYGLTNREKEILHELVKGGSKRKIADKLFLSFHTVDTHLKNIYAKLQEHTRSGVVAKVLKENLL